MKARFSFHRPVRKDSSQVITDRLLDIGVPDFMVLPDNLHMTLINDAQVLMDKLPKQLILRQTIFDVNRQKFGANLITPWQEIRIKTTGVVAVKDVVMMRLLKLDWLSKERENLMRVALLPENRVLPAEDYTPHVTIGKFVGTLTDYNGLYEYESQLQQKLQIGKIAFDPLMLVSGEHTWQFARRTPKAPGDSA